MKKFRVNVKRLTMTLGVLGTSAGLLAFAAWHQAPLAASQPPGDPALVSEPTADELAALGEAARSSGRGNALEAGAGGSELMSGREAPPPVDPVQALGEAPTDELRDPKAGKHGPTAMAVAMGVAAEAEGLDKLGAAGPAAAKAPAADPNAPAQVAAQGAAADVPLEPGAAGESSLADETPVTAGKAPLVTLAAMDPAPARVAAAPARRAAVGWRPVGRIWRGENAGAISSHPTRPEAVAPTAVAEVGEARYDAAARALAIPVDGRLGRRGLVIHRLGDGRAYVDLPGTRPTFSGSRSQDVPDGPITRWVMAAHAGSAGAPATRVAFRLADGVAPRLEVGGGEVRIALAGGPTARGTGGARVATTAAAPVTAQGVAIAARPASAGTKVGEARYDVAAGVLSLPLEGSVDPASLRLKRLGDGRAYLDVPGAAPAFSGTRSAEYPGQQLTRWKMAGHAAGGSTTTRLAFTLARPGEVDVRVADGEIRLTLPGHTGIRSAPAAPSMSEEEAVDADVHQ